MASSSPFVAELQGFYGPFTLAERVVQKIWLHQDFAFTHATLLDGRAVEILSPGRWNLLGGPDFKGARLRIGERELTGDVEVHFHAADWTAHGHADNPAFADVVLHVLLFPPAPGARKQRRQDGVEIPALVLLPLLHRDLEDYSADDALETITARDSWRQLEELAAMPFEAMRERLGEMARRRWDRKVEHAAARVAKLGWEGAAHHAALEILGYRHNRAPMLEVAGRWPLKAWRDSRMLGDPMAEIRGWQRHGVRPANRPEARLHQYRRWVALHPQWPEEMRDLFNRLPDSRLGRATGSGEVRRELKLGALRDALLALTVGTVGGPRLDTLVCDGFLPLVSADDRARDRFGLWFHWFAGDLPDQIRQGVKRLGVVGTRAQPICHGYAQGLLGWLIEREFRA